MIFWKTSKRGNSAYIGFTDGLTAIVFWGKRKPLRYGFVVKLDGVEEAVAQSEHPYPTLETAKFKCLEAVQKVRLEREIADAEIVDDGLPFEVSD